MADMTDFNFNKTLTLFILNCVKSFVFLSSNKLISSFTVMSVINFNKTLTLFTLNNQKKFVYLLSKIERYSINN